MGSGYVHTCHACGYAVKTSGPWEFFRDRDGQRQFAGHPGYSVEALPAGIAGYTARIYCPDCDTESEIVVLD